MKKNKGGLVVEMALVLPFVLFLLFNLIFGALMLYDRNLTQDIAKSKGRKYAIDASNTLQSNVANYSGFVYGNEQNAVHELKRVLGKKLIIYEVDPEIKDLFVSDDAAFTGPVTVKAEAMNATVPDKQTEHYKVVAVDDADIVVTVHLRRKEGSVPIIASLICPETLVVKSRVRVEMRINKEIVVNSDLLN